MGRSDYQSFFTKATEAWPPVKQQLTIRLDTDVLNWLKANGRGYQTRQSHFEGRYGEPAYWPLTFPRSAEEDCRTTQRT